MVWAERVQEHLVNDSELEDQVDRCREPVHVEIDRMAAPAVYPKVDRENHNLNDSERKEDRKGLMQFPPIHGADNNDLQDWLRNPESELDLGAGHRSHPGLRGLQAQ